MNAPHRAVRLRQGTDAPAPGAYLAASLAARRLCRMTVTTRTFSPSPALYRRLALAELVRRMAWVNALALFALVYGLAVQRWLLVVGALLWLAGTYGYAYWRLGKTLSDPGHAVLFAPRHYTFTPTAFTTVMDEGATQTHPYDTLARVVREADHLRLYVSKDGFLFVPHEAFHTDDDRRTVDGWLETAPSA